MRILPLYRISYSPKTPIPLSFHEVKYVVNVKTMSVKSFLISSQCPKPHEKSGSKFFDQSVDVMHRPPNTSPNIEAVVHRYSRKQLF